MQNDYTHGHTQTQTYTQEPWVTCPHGPRVCPKAGVGAISMGKAKPIKAPTGPHTGTVDEGA